MRNDDQRVIIPGDIPPVFPAGGWVTAVILAVVIFFALFIEAIIFGWVVF
jgi:hypothetical protein